MELCSKLKHRTKANKVCEERTPQQTSGEAKIL